MKIITERLKIRELKYSDWRQLKSISEDFKSSEYSIYDMPLPTDNRKIQMLTRQLVANHLFFSVLLKNSRKMIGYICFHNDSGAFDLGYCFRSECHGRGLAFEACQAIMEYVRQKFDVKYFKAGTAVKNTPSVKLLKKLGFTMTGTEILSFHKDINGNNITFEGGIFEKNTSCIIRKARESDSTQIGAVHHTAWTETYSGLLPQSYLNQRSAEKSTELFRADKCRNIVTAEVNGAVVGFCGWGEFREPVKIEKSGEIRGIYLLDQYKGYHFGQEMLEYALSQLKTAGFNNAALWVLEVNEKAIGFYEKMGFKYSGISADIHLGKPFKKLLYVKTL